GSSARGERSRRRSGPGSSRPGRRSPCDPDRPWLCNLLGRVKTTRSAQPGHSLLVAVCARQGEHLVLASLQRLPVSPERCQLLVPAERGGGQRPGRSEEHTSELQSRETLVCRLLLEKKNTAGLRMHDIV